MMEKDLVSIIVPMYNSERYIEKCLNSLINQTYSNLEIIVIDNCSKDGSVNVVKRIQKNDSRIILIQNEKTFTVGYSRNIGLDNAKGDYIWFVDSDDFAENEFLSIMLQKFGENPECNIIQCCYRNFDDLGNVSDTLPYSNDKIYTGKELCKIMNEFVGLCGPNVMVWNKLYRSKILKDKRFYEADAYEDMYFTYKVFYEENKILWIKDRLMNWRKRLLSATSSINYSHKFINEIYAYIERAAFYNEKQEVELYNLTLKRMYYILTQHLYRSKDLTDENAKTRMIYFKQLIKVLYPKLKKMNWPIYTRFRMWFIYHFPMAFGALCTKYKLDFRK